MTPLAERRAHPTHVDGLAHLLADCDLRHRAAHDRSDLPLQVAHAGLTRVLADDGADRVLGQSHLVRAQAVRRQLLGDEEDLRDVDLLDLGVAGEVQHLHAVAQGGRNRVKGVGGGDEHHLGEVERNVQVVVAEVLVLLGVEHLEQGR